MASSTLKGPESVSVTADGVKTNNQLLNSLFSLVNLNKINKDCALFVWISSTAYNRIPLTYLSTSGVPQILFTSASTTDADVYISRYDLQTSNSRLIQAQIHASGTPVITNHASSVPASGTKYEIQY